MNSPHVLRSYAQVVKQITEARHYFQLLGCHKGSTLAALARARKDLAMQVHPDVNSAPNAHDLMSKVNAAYQALSRDPEGYARSLGGRRCSACNGVGCKFKQKGFSKRVETVCGECHGAGVV